MIQDSPIGSVAQFIDGTPMDTLWDAFGDHTRLRVVGGAARDLMLGRTPKDIDFATPATPDEIIAILDKAGIKYVPTGLQHGTISAEFETEGGSSVIYEITTLRIDAKTDGRHAEVQFTDDWKADAARRDFTFNAMSIDRMCNVYDYFGGFEDLQEGRIRFVGDPAERIREDYLRILRYFRFRNRYDYKATDPGTEAAIRDNAAGLKQISGERIWTEMKQILSTGSTVRIVSEMAQLGVLEAIGIEHVRLRGMAIARAATDNPVTVLAALLVDDAQARAVVDRWKLSKPEREFLYWLMFHKNIHATQRLLRQIAVTKGKERAIETAALSGPSMLHENIVTWHVPEFPVDGKDLLSIGVAQGPDLGKVLKQLREVWLDSNCAFDKTTLLSQVSVSP